MGYYFKEKVYDMPDKNMKHFECKLIPRLILFTLSISWLICNAAVALEFSSLNNYQLKFFENDKRAILLAQNDSILGIGEPKPVKTLKIQSDGKILDIDKSTAILLEESLGGVGDPKRTTGKVSWKLETIQSTLTTSSDIGARATVDLEEAGLTANIFFKRNRDQTSANTHLIEITMTPTADNPNGKVRDISVPELRVDEKSRGTTLAGIAAPVSDNLFLIGLNGLAADKQRNIELLRSRNWFLIPMRYSDGKRALLLFEKGKEGKSVVNTAMEAWADDEQCGPLLRDEIIYLTNDPVEILRDLKSKGAINSTFSIQLLNSLFAGLKKPVQDGTYLFRACSSIRDIYNTISNGPGIFDQISIPDARTSFEIMELVRSNSNLVGEIKDIPKEGTLLPEIYTFSRGTLRNELLERMARDQINALNIIWSNRSPNLPLANPMELVTLASIIEKETALPAERSRIAAVLINRLRAKMPLQSDPTVIYGLIGGNGSLGHDLTKTDLLQSTPYNTYLTPGLPVGPITNPGRATLMEAAKPLESHELYYLADGTGKHLFAETLEQHLANVRFVVDSLEKQKK
jgi:hypothetical protein